MLQFDGIGGYLKESMEGEKSEKEECKKVEVFGPGKQEGNLVASKKEGGKLQDMMESNVDLYLKGTIEKKFLSKFIDDLGASTLTTTFGVEATMRELVSGNL